MITFQRGKASRFLSCVAAATLLLAASSERAAQANDKQKARRLFRQGNRLFAAKKLEEALAKFRAARELFASYKIDLNIASTLSELGRLPEAARFYEGFLREGWEKAPPSMVKGAREKLDELKAQLGVIALECATTDAAVTLDGKLLGRTPIQERIYVMPGGHQLAISKDGYQRHLETLTLNAGQNSKIAVTLKEVVAEPEPEPKPAPTPAPPAKDQASSWGWKKTAGWVSLGVGGAALVTGVIFSALAASKASEYDDLKSKTWEEQQEAGIQDVIDQNERYKTGQVVTLVLGGVAAAAGGGLLLWHYLGGEKAAGTQAQFAPLLGPGVVGACSSFRF